MSDAPRPEVDFVMPVFNEGRNIARALEELYDHVPLSKRVLIVYDFPEDDTVPVVRGLAGRYPGVELVENRLGRGVLDAIRSGIAAASAEVVIVTMADLSDDMAVVPQMVELIRDQGYDIVCASRYMRGGRQVGGPWLKGLMSRCAGVSLYWLAGLPTHDATNAFRAYRREVLLEFPIESRGGFAYSLEITAKAFAAGRRITEVPSTWRDRSAGQSRFRLRAWLPHYLRWYWYALTHRPRRRRPSEVAGRREPGRDRADRGPAMSRDPDAEGSVAGSVDPPGSVGDRPPGRPAAPRWAEAASVVVLLALIAASAIRADLRRSFSVDELFTYYGTLASGPAELMEVLSSGGFDASPPLYDLAAWGLRRLIGNEHLACRLPATLGYLAACLCLYAFARRRCPAPYAAVAMLTLPASVEGMMGSTARPYGLMLGFAGLALICWQAAAGGRWRALALVGLAASLAAGVATHYYAVLLLAPLGLAELTRTFAARRGKVDVPVWIAFAFAFAPLPFLLPLMKHSRELARGAGWLPVTRRELFKTFDDYTPQLVPAILGFGVLLERIGLVGRPRAATGRGAGLPARAFPAEEVALILGLLALPILGFAIGLAVTKAYTSRYVIAYLAGVALLLAYAGAGLFRGRIGPGLVLAGAMLLLIARLVGRDSGDWAWQKDLDRFADRAAASGRQLAIVSGDEYLVWHFYADPRTAARMTMIDFADAAHTNIFKNLNRWRVRKGLESFRIAEKETFHDQVGRYYVFGRLEVILQEGRPRPVAVAIIDYPQGGAVTDKGLFEVKAEGGPSR